MNKILNKLFVLLLFVAFPSTVLADSFVGTLQEGAGIVSHIFYTGQNAGGTASLYRDQNSAGMFIYHYNGELYSISGNGKTYKSICIDAGVPAGTGGGTKTPEVSCEPIDSPAIVSLIEDQGKDLLGQANEAHLKLEIALRALAMDAGITSGSENRPNTSAKAISNYVRNGSKTGATLLYNSSVRTGKGETEVNQISYADAGGDLLDGAKSLYDSYKTKELGSDETLNIGGNNTFAHRQTKVDKATKTFTYRLTSTKKMIKDNFKFECTGCTVSSFEWNGKSGTLVITATSADCIFKVDIKYKKTGDEDDSGQKLYLCIPKSSDGTVRNTQRFIAYDDSGTPDDNDYKIIDTINHDTTCDEDECECDENKFKDDVSINMCCDTSTESSVKQPKISDLFCEYKETNVIVSGYTANCVADSKFKVSGSDSFLDNNNYCTLYCTERINITIPKSTSGRNGKYFKLESATSDSKGPYFDGKKTCRLVTKYSKWLKAYEDATVNAVTQFNSYQEKKAIHDMYTNTYNNHIKDATEKTDKTEKRTAYYSTSSGSYTCEGVTHNNVSLSTSKSVDCAVKYKYYLTASDYTTVSYKQAKIEWRDNTSSNSKSPINTYYGFKIVNDTDGTTDTGMTGYYHASWASSTCGLTVGSSSVECEGDEVTCGDSTVKPTGTCYFTGLGNETITDVENNFKEKLKVVDTSGYENAVDYIDELERYLKECITYFDAGAENAQLRDEDAETGKGAKKLVGGEQGQYALYDFLPTASFYYFQAYVNGSSSKVTALNNEVPFKVTCTYGLEAIGDSGGDSDLGLEASHFNSLNSHKIAEIRNLKKGIKCLNNSGIANCTNTSVTASGQVDDSDRKYTQRYTTDAKYTATCTSTDKDAKSFVIYPYGSFAISSDTTSRLETEHDSSYYIEYSTMKAAYETYWQFTGLGSRKNGKGVFDSYFANNDQVTCASHTNNSGQPRLYCTLKVKSSLSKLQGCNEAGIISLGTGEPYYWGGANGCCKDGCDYTGEDELTYSFKIVDSEEPFPDGGKNDDDEEYAYNWYKTSYGTEALDKIKETGSKGNTFAENHKTYEFVLTTSDMEIIKKYNSGQEAKGKGGYSDFELTCQCADGEGHTSDNPCKSRFVNCTSSFITAFYQGKINDHSLSTAVGTSKLETIRSSEYVHKAS